MQRLLADAQELTGIEYDMSSLADVYSAIHAIQEELGIAGTTAKEASTTLTGSLSAVAAAGKNVLADLALGNELDLSALTDTLITFLSGNLLPMVLNLVKALPGAVSQIIRTGIPKIVTELAKIVPEFAREMSTAAPELIRAAAELIRFLSEAIPEYLPQIIQVFGEIMPQLQTGMLEAVPELVAAAALLIEAIVGEFANNIDLLSETGITILQAVIEGIGTAMPDIIGTVSELITFLLENLAEHYPELISAGFEVLESVISGIWEAMPDINAALLQLVVDMVTVFANTDWVALGMDIIGAIGSGIASMASSLIQSAITVAKKAYVAIATVFHLDVDEDTLDALEKKAKSAVASFFGQDTAGSTSQLSASTYTSAAGFNNTLRAYDALTGYSQAALSSAAANGTVVNLYQTVNTHDSLSEYELTKEAENFAQRAGWKNK